MKNENRRSKVVNKKIRNELISLGLFTFMLMVVIFTFLFIVIPAGDFLINSAEEFMAMTSLLLIFIIVFGMISFAFGYLYSQEIFFGTFKRLDKICRSVIDGKKTENLIFRKKDRFLFFAETFNEMLAALQKEKPSEEKK